MKRIFKLILLFVVISTISFGKTAYKPMYVQSSEGTLICDRETKEPLNEKYEIIDNDIWGREYVAMEAEIKNGLLHGKCIEYVSAGKMLRQANYKNGKLHGKFEGITYLNGTKLPNYEFVVIGNYKNGGFDGKIIYYRTVFTEEDKDSAAFKLIEKGYKGIMRTKCEEVYYEDGIRNGSYKMWFTNGKIARDYIFENGKSVRMKNYYLNGSLQTDGRTEKNGDVYEKEYYENGKLKAEFKGNLNTLNMTRKEYDETGKVIKEEKVENGVRVL